VASAFFASRQDFRIIPALKRCATGKSNRCSERPNFLKSPRHCDVVCEGGEKHIARRNCRTTRKECSGTRKGCPNCTKSVSVVGLLLAMTNAVLGLAAISRKRRLKKSPAMYWLNLVLYPTKYFVTRITFYRRIEIFSRNNTLCPFIKIELAPQIRLSIWWYSHPYHGQICYNFAVCGFHAIIFCAYNKMPTTCRHWPWNCLHYHTVCLHSTLFQITDFRTRGWSDLMQSERQDDKHQRHHVRQRDHESPTEQVTVGRRQHRWHVGRHEGVHWFIHRWHGRGQRSDSGMGPAGSWFLLLSDIESVYRCATYDLWLLRIGSTTYVVLRIPCPDY
jgi:hypothetical protein